MFYTCRLYRNFPLLNVSTQAASSKIAKFETSALLSGSWENDDDGPWLLREVINQTVFFFFKKFTRRSNSYRSLFA
jgi:hypothetical protein